MSKTKQVNLNTDELEGFLTHIINNNRYLQAGGKLPSAVEIVGESGIGKTSVALQLANKLGLNMVKLNLAQIEELGDLIGYPIQQFQMCPKTGVEALIEEVKMPSTLTIKKKVKRVEKQMVTVMEEQEIDDFEVKIMKKQVLEAGKFVMKDVETRIPVKKTVQVPVDKEMDIEIEEEVEEVVPAPVEDSVPRVAGCRWVDAPAVDEYIKRGYEFTGEKRMGYCPPEWIADKKGGGILLLDDWNRADIRFIQAVMELVDRQEYISWKLPKDWHIMLTSNPDNGEYLVNSIDNAQRTRFISVNLKSDVHTWARWAESQGIDGRCINFLLMHPDLISVKTNPRSITTFFNAISSFEDFSANLPMIQMIGEGSVGPEFAQMFSMFINNKLDKLVSPHDILLHDNETYILGQLRGCIGTGASYRADIASILTTRFINYTLHYAQSNTIYQKNIDRIIKLATDEDTLTDDLKYIIVKKILNGNKAKFQKMMANAKVVEMSLK